MFNYCPPKEIPKIESQTFSDGKRYYVTPEGKKLPSVTTVVGAQKKQAIIGIKDLNIRLKLKAISQKQEKVQVILVHTKFTSMTLI